MFVSIIMSIKNLNNLILAYLAEKQSASPEELACLFDASPSTIRRRLSELSAKGLVRRSRGSVKLRQDNNFAQSFTFRKHQNSLAKKRIALEAVKLIKNGDVIFLDGSSSVYFIAQYLDQFENIKVITNGLDTLSLLSQNGVTAYSTGGKISSLNNSVLVGSFAEKTVADIHADICFFSALSIDENGTVWDISDEENSVRKNMIFNSDRKVFMCDSSKTGRKSTFSLGRADSFDYMVCDVDVSDIIDTGRCTLLVCPA